MAYYSELSLEPIVANCVEAIAGDYEGIIASMQCKFDALYAHCCNLAKELNVMDEKISAYKVGDQVQKMLCDSQKQLIQSTMALLKKEKKTKFITDP